jgi:hypothetical protein
VEVGYHRRWLQNYTSIDNILTLPSDYTPFSIVAPVDSRLPDGGGYVVSGLYDPVQSVASVFNSFSTRASNFGSQYQDFDGVLFNISSRVRSGLTVQGGVNAGKTVSDNCEIRAQVPELALAVGFSTSAIPAVGLTSPYCHFDSGLVWRVTSLAAYVIPRIDVQVSGAFRSDQGSSLVANYSVTSAIANQGPQPLGRNLSNNAAFVTVNLIPPGTLYGDRVNELDFKVAKILKLGRTRTNVGVEIYNVLNSDAVLIRNELFNPNVAAGSGSSAWLAPRQVLTPRFFKLSAQVEF